MQHFLKSSTTSFRRVSAIRPDDAKSHLSLRAWSEFHTIRRFHASIDTVGAVGCSLSHIKVWKQFLETDAQFCVVLEDDILPEQLQDYDDAVHWMMNVRHAWDLAVLGWVAKLPKKNNVVRPYPITEGFHGSHAYLYKRHVVEALFLNALPLEMQVDRYIQAMSVKHGFRMMSHPLKNLRQGVSGSDVFSICILCEPLILLKAAVITALIIAFLLWKLFNSA